ncbi:GNAT family N-acetyltransferase [Nocardioidaceae bacterium SCSIO 66511]|nr:GNAT family N-acetyltransferase [Nocardioidaceae bacterium SCSIO 66511]
MTRPEIRVDRAADDERFLATDQTVWFGEISPSPTDTQLLGVPENQRFAVEVDDTDPGTYAGIYGVRPMELAVPASTGRASLVPCAGLTWVGVHPDHRRRGVLTAMLRHHVEQTHREGVALSALHASEPAIYGRHGYGLATQEYELSLGRGTELRAPGLEEAAKTIRTSFATASDQGVAERLRECVLRSAPSTPGVIIGAQSFYSGIVDSSQRPEALRDNEPTRFLFAVRDGADVGVAVFRRHQKWEQARPKGKLEIFALEGDPATRLALLRRLLDFDLIATVTVPRVGVDDPLWSWIGPRVADDLTFNDNLWIRIVDLPAALPLRAYAADCDVVVDVDDPAAPWQAGRWRIRIRGGEAVAERTDDPADLAVPIAVLGSAYLGGANLIAMRRAGVLDELRSDAVAELSRAFRSDVAPYPATGF